MRLSRSGVSAFAVGFAFLACGTSDDISVSGVGGGGGRAFGGSGGVGGSIPIAGVGGAAGSEPGPVGGATSLTIDPSGNGMPEGPLNEYSPDACAAGSFGVGARCFQYFVCERPCQADSDCPDGGSGSPNVACVSEGFPTPVCVLRCGDGAVCPDGMQCVMTGEPALGSACLWPTPTQGVWGCPGSCAELGQACTLEVGAGLRTVLPAQFPCCEGTVCAPWGCEPGTCLQPTWPCTQDGPACCNGACQNGFCPPN